VKRFYRDAAAAPDGDAYGITLDGKPLRTPAKRALTLPGLALAEAIAAEWHAQEDQVDPGSMPLMRFASTAIDRVADRPEAVIDEIARYGAADLLCYRAGHPPDLVARQRQTWQPLLDWARDHFDAALEVTVGVVPLTQPPRAVAALRTAVAVHGPMPLTALHAVTTVTGSAVLGLALAEQRIDAEAAWAASQLDETFQIEQWGEDSEASERRAALKVEIAAAARFMALCRA
jgi:chaperone required for assembly of F1-ATPase